MTGTSAKTAKRICSVCRRKVRATEAALWQQDASGQRSHTHIECLRTKAAAMQELPAP